MTSLGPLLESRLMAESASSTNWPQAVSRETGVAASGNFRAASSTGALGQEPTFATVSNLEP